MPAVKWKVHDCLGIAALDTTASIGGEPVEHALPYFLVDGTAYLRQTT